MKGAIQTQNIITHWCHCARRVSLTQYNFCFNDFKCLKFRHIFIIKIDTAEILLRCDLDYESRSMALGMEQTWIKTTPKERPGCTERNQSVPPYLSVGFSPFLK